MPSYKNDPKAKALEKQLKTLSIEAIRKTARRSDCTISDIAARSGVHENDVRTFLNKTKGHDKYGLYYALRIFLGTGIDIKEVFEPGGQAGADPPNTKGATGLSATKAFELYERIIELERENAELKRQLERAGRPFGEGRRNTS